MPNLLFISFTAQRSGTCVSQDKMDINELDKSLCVRLEYLLRTTNGLEKNAHRFMSVDEKLNDNTKYDLSFRITDNHGKVIASCERTFDTLSYVRLKLEPMITGLINVTGKAALDSHDVSLLRITIDKGFGCFAKDLAAEQSSSALFSLRR